MKAGRAMGCVAALLVLAASWVCGQTSAATGPGMRILSSASRLAQARAGGEVVREIDDPHSGDRWLLERNPDHPGGPGLLFLLASGSNLLRQDQSVEASRTEARPVVHGGDRLIVEENTAVVEARLEAVALGPAAVGSVFDARLRIGGRVVRAVALGPGRAELQPDGRARP